MDKFTNWKVDMDANGSDILQNLYCDDNFTDEFENGTNQTYEAINKAAMTVFLVSSYSLICVGGLVGNLLVIYVVTRFAKMKTVTNLYILNLAISDVLFLISLPFLITTTILEHWIFETAMCKIFFVLYAINFVTSVFTLTALSGDRYLAVCHPIRSGQYRTTNKAFFICLCIWTVSFIVMLPIILYSNTVPNPKNHDWQTCTIKWPKNQLISPNKAFTWYTFLLGFAIPVSMISVFYLSVVLRLKTVGPAVKSKEKKRSHRKVTKMVLTVISVYVICWLPHWVFQVNLTFHQGTSPTKWQIYVFNAFTVLTFANSMLNPLLYAFLSDNFRKSFAKAFKCATQAEINKSLINENSVFTKLSGKRKNGKNNNRKSERYELTTQTVAEKSGLMKSESVPYLNEEEKRLMDKTTNMYVDKESQT